MRLLGQANPVPARGRLSASLASALPAHPITVDSRDAPVLLSLVLWREPEGRHNNPDHARVPSFETR
jgi:hypothetical protein